MKPVQSFFLYGEPPRAVDAGFLHVEPLGLRSRAAHWTIRPHAHRDLVQLFLVERGGGEMRTDGATQPTAAPCLVLVPAGTIHAFAWAPGSGGRVLTIGARTLDHLVARAPELARLFAAAVAIPLADAAAARRLDALLRQLNAERAWNAPGHEAAAEALLVLVLVEAMRIGGIACDLHARDAALVARFREQIEASFRDHPTLASLLAALGVSERRLRDACRRVARRAPMQMVLDRTMLEARQMLVSSNRTAAEIGYGLGFTDPAYFSRLFRAQTGQGLREFRKTVTA